MCSLLFSNSRQAPAKAAISKFDASSLSGMFIIASFVLFSCRLQPLAIVINVRRRLAIGGYCWQAG